MSHPQDLSLSEQARRVGAGELEGRELLEATLTRIEERNGGFRAIAETFAERSLAMLENAPPGPLHGVPVTVKDMFSLPWRGYRNGTRRELGPRSASGVFKALRDAGAIVVGVDNQHELGMGTTGVVSPHGPAANPWNPERCAGGSSGGSAAAVAGRLVGGAVGSDSGGSTRLPAGWCGVTGLKLTYGSVSYEGYTGANSTLSAPGVFARDGAGARLLAEALTRRTLAPSDAAAGDGLRVGLVRRPYWEDVDPEVAQACTAALAGFETVELELPFATLAGPAAAIRAGAELGLAVPREAIGELHPLTRGLLHYMAAQPAHRLLRADRVRARLRRELRDALATVDMLAWPTNPAPAPPIAAPVVSLPSGPSPPDGPNVRQAALANLTGAPAVSVPVGFHSSGLPIGLQLLASWGGEARLLDAAERIERESGRTWVDAEPPHPSRTASF